MKSIIKLLFLLITANICDAQTMVRKRLIKTSIGQIAVFENRIQSEKTPIIFLHGVYFDHNLWENQITTIKDRTVFSIDMPLHGQSREKIKKDWNLNDCANMLLEILDSLNQNQVIAIGHSWGSMTIIRAANKLPNKFASIGLCNMPFTKTPSKTARKIKLQHSAMIFRGLYMKQAGKALFGKETLKNNGESLLGKLTKPMKILSNSDLKFIDKAVRIEAEEATEIIKKSNVRMYALIGEEDYVGVPPIKNYSQVKGGHISPLEAPIEVNKMIQLVIESTEK